MRGEKRKNEFAWRGFEVTPVSPESRHHSRPAGTITDQKGGFTLVHLPPGQYRLKGIRNGYLETKAMLLSLGAGAEQKGLPLKLLPFAVIAGAVRDPEGEALAEAPVAVIAVTYRNGLRQLRATGQFATTDDLGQYRIPSVRPGHYYVRDAAARPDGRTPVDRSP